MTLPKWVTQEACEEAYHMSKAKREKYAEAMANAKPLTQEEIDQCVAEGPRALSRAIRALFDDDDRGGDFYAHIVAQMVRHYDDPRIPTAAVSVTNKLNLYINSVFFIRGLGWDLDFSTTSTQKIKQRDEVMLERQVAVIKHELLHCIFMHMFRGQDYGNPKLANVAADLVVNSCIDDGLLPVGLFPADFGLPKDKTMDWYYSNYPIEDHPLCEDPSGHDKQWQKQQGSPGDQDEGDGDDGEEDEDGNSPGGEDGEGGDQPGEGDGQGEGEDGDGNGSGEGEGDGEGEGEGEGSSSGSSSGSGSGSGHGNGNGKAPHNHAVGADGKCKVCKGTRPFDAHDVWGKDGGEHMSEAMKESLIKDAVNQASEGTKNAGTLPSAVQQAIALAKKKPQIPWQILLKQFVSRLANGELRSTKKRRSKRYGTRPGNKINPKLKLCVLVDVSGSISDREYEIFLNEIFAITKHIGTVDVVEWDVKVQGVRQIKGYKPDITRYGRGGTDPREALQWANDRKHKYDGAICFSDGYFCVDVNNPIRIPMMFVITSDGTDSHLDKRKHRVIRL